MQAFGSLTAAAVLGTLMLSGCGGSDEDFCDAYDTLESETDLSTPETLDEVGRLADNAPGDIQDDVDVLADGANAFRDAAEDADLDLEDVDSEEALSEEQQAALDDALDNADVSDEDTFEATANIDEWTRENCS